MFHIRQADHFQVLTNRLSGHIFPFLNEGGVINCSMTNTLQLYCVYLIIKKAYAIINKEHHSFFQTVRLSASWFFSFPSFIAVAAPGCTISLDWSLSNQLYSTGSPYCPYLTMSLGINTPWRTWACLFVCLFVSLFVCVRVRLCFDRSQIFGLLIWLHRVP